jgi:uncharacterized membrane protein (UPF0127 family)
MIATQNISKTKTRVLTIFSILAIGALFVVLFLYGRGIPVGTEVPTATYEAFIVSGDLRIPVTIADTPAEQEQGLSGTTFLPTNTGKLFIFPTPGRYGFWMKDMQYPLDLIWIDSTMHIVGITAQVAPETYPTVFYPPEDVLSVLEVAGGFSTAHHLEINQLLTLSDNLSF